jgi:DNA repair protein RadC
MTGGIREWPEDERPREKMLKKGAVNLSDAELLALIIRSGDPATKQSAIGLGRELIGRFGGSLRELAAADLAEITAVKGMGLAKASGIKAAFTLASRFQGRRLERLDRFTSPRQVFDYFHHEFRDLRKEYFLALLLDGKNRIIRRVQVSASARRSGNRPQPSSWSTTTPPAIRPQARRTSPLPAACARPGRSWVSRSWTISLSGMGNT